MESITLRNGVGMPSIAFGCAFGDWVGRTDFQGFLPEQAWRSMSLALDAGYRSFDGAHVYATERILGNIMGERFARGKLKREDLFLTTKLAHPLTPPHVNISHLRTWDADKVDSIAKRVRDDFAKTLDGLAVGYVDLLLIHWPGPFANKDASFARQARATIWKTFIDFYKKGSARAIGVCNFTAQHLSDLIDDVPDEIPMVNQVEIHPYCRDQMLEQFCVEKGIALTAYAPFASGAFEIFDEPELKEIAEKHKVSVGQVILRWHLQNGRSVLPKTTKEHRMKENLDVFGFTLSEEELKQIDELGQGEPRRTCPDPASIV